MTMSAGSLKSRRDALGLSQEALGEKIGVDGMTVSRWERGESLPQRRFWSGLEQLLGSPVGELIGIPGAMQAAADEQEPAR